jgi:hypothetical protein
MTPSIPLAPADMFIFQNSNGLASDPTRALRRASAASALLRG